MRATFILTLGLLAAGCEATTHRLRSAAADVETVDPEASDLLARVADLVEARTATTLTGLTGAAEGGILGILGAAAAAFGLHKRRKWKGESPPVPPE